MLRLGLDEIAAVEPQPGEDGELATEAEKLGARRRAAAGRAAPRTPRWPATRTTGRDGADVTALLGAARRALERTSRAPTRSSARWRPAGRGRPTWSPTSATELASYGERLDADPARLAAVEERRAALRALTRKYGARGTSTRCWPGRRPRPSGSAELDISEDALAALAAERDAAERGDSPSWPPRCPERGTRPPSGSPRP